MKTLIDVSRYQGEIDWAKVAQSGIDGAFLKAVSTNKSGLYVDPYFARNYEQATANGLPCGAYFYTYAVTKEQMDKELALFKSACTGKEWLLPLVVDVEDNKLKRLSREELTDLTAYACHQIESWGVYCMIYTYTSFASAEMYFQGAALRPFGVWLADYTGHKPAFPYEYQIHQYTSKGKVPGISGPVDLSETSRDYPAIIRNANLRRIK